MKPHKKSLSLVLILLIALILVTVLPNGYVYAAGDQNLKFLEKQNEITCCPRVKVIRQIRNERTLRRNGFYIDLFGTGSLDFSREGRYKYATLGVAQDLSGQYAAARVTEVDTSLPPEQRTKCWQPTKRFDVVVNYTIRFLQPENPGLTETMLLWNSPLGETGSLPYTAVGLTRNQLFGGYMAMIAQDLIIAPDGYTGTLYLAPVPEWLDPTAWHDVRLTVSKQAARIELSQGENDYTVVLDVDLPNPVEPLAMEFSLDNEILPGLIIPVFEPDSLDIASLSLFYKHHR